MPPQTTPHRPPRRHRARRACRRAAGRRPRGRRRRPRRRPAGGARRRPDADPHHERRADASAHADPHADADRLADAHADAAGTDRPRCDGHVLRPRLRSRRRDVAVRRPRPRPRRPERRRRSSPTTTAARRSGRSRRTTRIRVRVLYALDGDADACRSSSTAGVAPWTIDGIAATVPGRRRAAASSRRPRRRATGPHTTWRLRVTSAAGAVLYSGPKPTSLVVRGATEHQPAPAVVEADRTTTSTAASCGSGPRRPCRPSRVVNDLPLETYLRGVVPAEMSVDLAGGGAPGAGDRLALVRRPPAPTRPSRTTTSPTTRRRRSTTARSASTPTTNAIDRGDRRGRAPERVVDRQHAVPLGRRRRDREQRERLHLVDRGQGRRRRVVPARLDGSGRDRHGIRRRVAVRDLGDADLHARAAVGLVRRRHADRTSATLTAIDLRNRGVSGRLISVTLIGSAGTKTRLGRRLPVGLQRRTARAPTRCSAARSSRPRRSPDPALSWAG